MYDRESLVNKFEMLREELRFSRTKQGYGEKFGQKTVICHESREGLIPIWLHVLTIHIVQKIISAHCPLSLLKPHVNDEHDDDY